LCDELSLGLAPRIVDRIYALMPEIRRRGITIMLVEQDISRSLAVCDRFYYPNHGFSVTAKRR